MTGDYARWLENEIAMAWTFDRPEPEPVTAAPDTEATAAHHARLIAHARRSGRPRGAHDLIIAAHAVETDRIVVSRDAAARFGDLPGVAATSA